MSPILGDTSATYFQRISLVKSMERARILPPRYMYEAFDAYYRNNGLYDGIQQYLADNATWTPAMKPLRNPVNRSVEFYVSKLWPGSLPKALPIVTANKSLLPAIETIWTWSNWGVNKQVVARHLASLGDSFIKVELKTEMDQVTRVFLDPIRPMNVVDFEVDERGFLTFIRIDVPNEDAVHTEVWSKEWGGVRAWTHTHHLDADLDDLGRPEKAQDFDSLGFDFIPVAHAKFRDLGHLRGAPCFAHALDKIDEANRQATRLHQILFRYNKPTMAVLANDNDNQGRPLPPPILAGAFGSSDDTDSVIVSDDDVWSLPGRSRVDQLVPNLDYAGALDILNAQIEEITKDLPETLYFELQDRGELSGVALKILLGPAIDRAVEARGNAEPALIRIQEMALTIATLHGVIESVGSFEDGDYIHSFAERDVIATSKAERASNIAAETQSGIPLVTAMLHNGFTEEEVADMKKTPEYKLFLAKQTMEVAKIASEAGIPLETILSHIGWTKEQLETMGTQRLAEIILEQEDIIPETRQ